QQARPVVAGRNRALLVVRRFRMLVGHLEEEEEGELLDVVAVAHSVIAEDVAEVPEFLYDCGWGHVQSLLRLIRLTITLTMVSFSSGRLSAISRVNATRALSASR